MRTEQDSTPAQRGGDTAVVSAGARFWTPLAVSLLTVGVLVAAIMLSMSSLRSRLRAFILEEDVIALHGATSAAADEIDPEEKTPWERVLALASASNVKKEDIFGIRLFDAQGQFIISFTPDVLAGELTPEALSNVRAGKPFGRLEREFDVSSLFRPGLLSTIINPVLFAAVPLENESGEIIGAAEFLLNGAAVLAKLNQVDREVGQSEFWFSLASGAVVLGMLGWAFSRLNRTNKLLAERTANLLRANHELTMAAKTSAVGAVAAHLIHGLKNPLFGLQAFVAIKSEDAPASEWKAAVDSTKRMQTMIADVVRILREEAGESAYEVSIGELVGILESKIAPTAQESSVRFETSGRVKGALANREANLVILALTNLIHNAIQASKAGTKVSLTISESEGSVCFDVADEAGGLPAAMQKNLFMPCQSSKTEGTGLGLAISKQLANQMGGQLDLMKTDAKGTTFRLTIPQQLFSSSKNAGEKGTLQTANAVA